MPVVKKLILCVSGLLLLLTGCAKKVVNPGFGDGGWNQTSHIVTEKIYYAKPKQAEVSHIHYSQSFHVRDTAKKITGKRERILLVYSDSVNPQVFRGNKVEKKIESARENLILAEKKEKVHSSKSFYILNDIFMGIILLYVLSFFTLPFIFGPAVGFYTFFIMMIVFLLIGLPVLILSFRSGHSQRMKAIGLIDKAPDFSSDPDDKINNSLESLNILKNYLPTRKFRRKIRDVRRRLKKNGNANDRKRLEALENYLQTRSQK